MQFAQNTQRPLPLFATPAQGNVIALRPAPQPATPHQRAAATPRQRITATAQPPRPATQRPLRLIVNRSADGSCKLVASGRLADVCAELNRLSLA